jgi:hypothetical protein
MHHLHAQHDAAQQQTPHGQLDWCKVQEALIAGRGHAHRAAIIFSAVFCTAVFCTALLTTQQHGHKESVLAGL